MRGGGYKLTCILCGGKHDAVNCNASDERKRRHAKMQQAAHDRADEEDFDENISLRRPPYTQRLKDGFKRLNSTGIVPPTDSERRFGMFDDEEETTAHAG